jgi:VCBS repeat-containing protein
MTTYYVPTERNEWFTDRNGMPATTKRKNEVKSYAIDFRGEMETGETISTKTVTASGVTVSASSITTGVDGTNTTVSITVTGSEGTVTVKVVTSSSRTLEKKVRFMEPSNGTVRRDYR